SRTWSIGVVFPLSTFRTIRTCYHQKHLLGFQLLQRSECMLIMYAYNTLLPVVAIFNTFMFKPFLSENGRSHRCTLIVVPWFDYLSTFLCGKDHIFICCF